MAVWASMRQFFLGASKSPSSKPPHLLKYRSSTLFIALTVNLAIFTDIFYYGLVIPVIPFSLTVQLGIPPDQVQHWTSILLACYCAALFVGAPIAGWYADQSASRRWPLLIGLVALAASTLLLCLGNSIGLLILGRLLQGFSAAIVWSVGNALLVDTMENAAGVAMGWVNISMSVGLLVGPVIGGAVYRAAGYYPVYYVAFGVVAVDILMRLLMIEKKVARRWAVDKDTTPGVLSPERGPEALDLETGGLRNSVDLDATQATAGNAALEKPSRPGLPEADPDVPDTAAGPPQEHGDPPAGTRATSIFHPVVVLLKSSRLLATLYGLFVEAGIMMAFDASLALFVQRTFHWTSMAAGILFIAIFTPGFISPLVGWLADKYGAKWPSLLGFACIVPLLVCLRFVADDSLRDKVLLAVLLALLGAALAFCNTPLMAELSYVIQERADATPGIFGDKGVYGMGYGLFTMAFALGGTVGPLWAGYVIPAAGWGTMTWSLAVWAASAALVIFIWLGKKDGKSGEQIGSRTERQPVE
ncbi:MFS general substrate transporter [Xylariaceae sp. FL0804]|nr:MFS general substrate transporter [Xylariaceae sp. FL0804]